MLTMTDNNSWWLSSCQKMPSYTWDDFLILERKTVPCSTSSVYFLSPKEIFRGPPGKNWWAGKSSSQTTLWEILPDFKTQSKHWGEWGGEYIYFLMKMCFPLENIAVVVMWEVSLQKWETFYLPIHTDWASTEILFKKWI